MAADSVIYSPENLTDHSQFERLRSDKMSQAGQLNIEPIGVTNDGGRRMC